MDVSEDRAARKRTVTLNVPAADAELNHAQLAHTTGLLELPSQAHTLSALTTVLGGAHASAGLTAQVNTALALPSELAPRSGAEGLLCAQMVSTHEAALVMLGRAVLPSHPPDVVDRQVTRAVRLQRLFLDQLAALAKLRGQGAVQTVRVEHEHRHLHAHGTVPGALPVSLPGAVVGAAPAAGAPLAAAHAAPGARGIEYERA